MAVRPRKARRRDARWLVTGLDPATRILHHGQQAYLQPVRSADHPKRYSTGQRLQLKPYVPGPSAGTLVVTSVQGKGDRFSLGQVTDVIARELGYESITDFQTSWIRANDVDWLERADPEFLNDLLTRFKHRWAPKLAWLLRFRLDQAAAPRMLALAGGSTGSFVTGAAGRPHYQPREDERESDRGYTSTDSLSLPDEHPALTDHEWETHVGPKSRYREWDRLRTQKAEREGAPVRARLDAAKATARTAGHDIRSEVQVAEAYLRRGKYERALQQIALIEQRVFPVAA